MPGQAYEVDRARPADLVRDVHAARVGVPDLRKVHANCGSQGLVAARSSSVMRTMSS